MFLLHVKLTLKKIKLAVPVRWQPHALTVKMNITARISSSPIVFEKVYSKVLKPCHLWHLQGYYEIRCLISQVNTFQKSKMHNNCKNIHLCCSDIRLRPFPGKENENELLNREWFGLLQKEGVKRFRDMMPLSDKAFHYFHLFSFLHLHSAFCTVVPISYLKQIHIIFSKYCP